MPHRIAKQIYTALEKAKSVLVIPHQNPDGDALGSSTALIHFLRKMGKEHTLFCATDYTPKLSYIPGIEHLTRDVSVWKDTEYDCIVVVDSGDLRYAGVDQHILALPKRPTIINIDHHPTNERYGDLNLVIPTASSTCELVYSFFLQNNVEIDSYMATCLLTGLITDTGNFTNAATTVHALTAASDLIQKGAKIKLIKELMFKDKTIDALKLWGVVLSRLAKHDTHEIVYTYLTQEDLQKHGIDDSEAEGIANFMNNLSDGKAGLILKELPGGKVKGSFRTTRNDVDVSAIAKALDGGGHKKAAGFTVVGTIEQALEKIWETIAGMKK